MKQIAPAMQSRVWAAAVVQVALDRDCSIIPLPAFRTEFRCTLEVAVARHPMMIRKSVKPYMRRAVQVVHRHGHRRATSLHGGFPCRAGTRKSVDSYIRECGTSALDSSPNTRGRAQTGALDPQFRIFAYPQIRRYRQSLDCSQLRTGVLQRKRRVVQTSSRPPC